MLRLKGLCERYLLPQLGLAFDRALADRKRRQRGIQCDVIAASIPSLSTLASSGRPPDMSSGALNTHNGRHVDGIRAIAMDCERRIGWHLSCKP